MSQNSDSTQVQAALTELLNDFVRRHQQMQQSLPCAPLQENWESPCVVRTDESLQQVFWQPVARPQEPVFAQLEAGLEVSIHPDLHSFYGSYWSDGIRVDSPWGEIGLIQVWNDEDLEYLKENLLGHGFMRQKQRRPLSFFVGVQKDNRVISLDNKSGHVLREGGKGADEVLSASLPEFLQQLTPNLQPYHQFQG